MMWCMPGSCSARAHVDRVHGPWCQPREPTWLMVNWRIISRCRRRRSSCMAPTLSSSSGRCLPLGSRSAPAGMPVVPASSQTRIVDTPPGLPCVPRGEMWNWNLWAERGMRGCC